MQKTAKSEDSGLAHEKVSKLPSGMNCLKFGEIKEKKSTALYKPAQRDVPKNL